MAANLRSAIRRAASRVVSEGLLVLLRGPRPNPAEADLLAKKADDAAKKQWVIQFTRRLIEKQKKTYESPNGKSLGALVPWVAAVASLMSGYEMGRRHGKLMCARQKPEESN